MSERLDCADSVDTARTAKRICFICMNSSLQPWQGPLRPRCTHIEVGLVLQQRYRRLAMQSPQAFNEERRLEALSQFDWVKALPDAVLDDLAKLAALVSEAPIALISFLGAVRQWFLSRVGWAAAEMSREISICAQTILQPGLFLVPDASKDERFRDMPYVAGDPRIRSYAGAPLVTAQGHAIGTLCVMDVVPRRLSLSQREALLTLSRQVMAHLELRRQARELEESEARVFKAFRSCPIALTINRVSDGAFLE